MPHRPLIVHKDIANSFSFCTEKEFYKALKSPKEVDTPTIQSLVKSLITLSSKYTIKRKKTLAFKDQLLSLLKEDKDTLYHSYASILEQKLLTTFPFENKYNEKIFSTLQGDEKLFFLHNRIKNYNTIHILLGLNGYHYSQIVRNADWRAKLKWLENKNNQELLETIGLNGSHYSQIVTGADWRAKLKWLENKNNQELLETIGLNGYHYSQIVTGADWEAKLKWLKNYLSISKKIYGLTPNRVSKELRKKDRKEWIEKFDEYTRVAKFIHEHHFDPSISPLVKSYLFFSIRSDRYDLNALTTLLTSLTPSTIEVFKNNMYKISGSGKKIQPKELYDILNKQYQYTELEIKMYALAINKNSKGLCSWYITGKMYQSFYTDKSLDAAVGDTTKTGYDYMGETDENIKQYESDQTIEAFLKEITKQFGVAKYHYRNNFIQGGCKTEDFNLAHAQEFDKEVQQLKSNQEIMELLLEIMG